MKMESREYQELFSEYPGIYGDWGFPELSLTDKYVYKREWKGRGLPAVEVEQFVMAYQVSQDRIRAMLPQGFESLRPVLRINTEIRNEDVVYIEFNTPVEADGRRGWLNIDCWKSSSGDDLHFSRKGDRVEITAPFLSLSYQGIGATGGCPAEKDNEGCYFLKNDREFRPAEKIEADREFCSCGFQWRFHEGDAGGEGTGEMRAARAQEPEEKYDQLPLSAENAAKLTCFCVLGAYRVRFRRYDNREMT